MNEGRVSPTDQGQHGIQQTSRRPFVAQTSILQEWRLHEWHLRPYSRILFQVVRPEENLDHNALRRAALTLQSRHEVLRTTISSPERIVVGGSSPLEVQDVILPAINTEAHFIRSISEFIEGNDLSPASTCLAQIKLYRTDTRVIGVGFFIEHIISDAVTVEILMDELWFLYDVELGRPSRIERKVGIGYSEYAKRQREVLTGETLRHELSFWDKASRGGRAYQGFRTDLYRHAVAVRTTDRQSARLTVERVRLLARQFQVTPSMFLLSVLLVSLNKLTGVARIPITIPSSNRLDTSTRFTAGWFAQGIVCEFDLTEQSSLANLCNVVRTELISNLRHAHVPYPLIVKNLSPHLYNDRPRDPLIFFNAARTLSPSSDKSARLTQVLIPNETVSGGGIMVAYEQSDIQAELTITLYRENWPYGFASGLLQEVVDRIDGEKCTIIQN